MRFQQLAACAVATATLLAAGTIRAADPDKKQIRYEGSARLFNLPSVTIIYPAGGDETMARLSARRRADYLRESWGTRTRVLSDAEVDQDMLEDDNLLLLGWTNDLLGGDGPEPPFRPAGDGRVFAGGIPIGDDEDLLFIHPSPWNPGRDLVFWSRLDPEIERFNSIPFVGSDWVVMRDYLIVAQGNFRESNAWPPGRNQVAEKDHRPGLTPLPEQARSEHFLLFHEPGALTAEQRKAVLDRREQAWAQAQRRLGRAPEGYRVRLYVYPDVERKKQRTGVPDPVHGIPRERELHMVHRYAANDGPHEEYHLLARALHGPAFLTSLYEGVAFYLDNHIHGANLCVNAGYLLEEQRVPRVETLLDEERFREAPREVAFAGAGLMAAWIVEQGGLPALWEAYNRHEIDTAELAALLDVPPDRIQPSYRQFLQNCRDEAGDEIAFRRALGEAQEAHRVGDHEALVAALTRAARARPGDPQVLLDLASAHLLSGDYEAAGRDIDRLLSNPLGDDQQHIAAFAHLQRGRIHDLLGRREAALAAYRKVLEYPDAYGIHELARAGLEEPVTAEDLW